jgi:hypothetical protein
LAGGVVVRLPEPVALLAKRIPLEGQKISFAVAADPAFRNTGISKDAIPIIRMCNLMLPARGGQAPFPARAFETGRKPTDCSRETVCRRTEAKTRCAWHNKFKILVDPGYSVCHNLCRRRS